MLTYLSWPGSSIRAIEFALSFGSSQTYQRKAWVSNTASRHILFKTLGDRVKVVCDPQDEALTTAAPWLRAGW